jgi:hypothetical protein
VERKFNKTRLQKALTARQDTLPAAHVGFGAFGEIGEINSQVPSSRLVYDETTCGVVDSRMYVYYV